MALRIFFWGTDWLKLSTNSPYISVSGSSAVSSVDLGDTLSSRLVTKAATAPASKAVVPVPINKAASSFCCRANSVSAKPRLLARLAKIIC